MYSFHTGPPKAIWTPGTVNQELQSLGLTQETLVKEIANINEKAAQFTSSHPNSKCRYTYLIVLALLIAGTIVVTTISYTSDLWYVWPFVVVFLSLFAINYFVRAKHHQLWNDTLQHTENYINSELSQKYSSMNIQWSVRVKTITYNDGYSETKRGRRRTREYRTFTIKFDDIVCTPLYVIQSVPLQVQQPQVIVVVQDQNGRPIQQPMQQQIVIQQPVQSIPNATTAATTTGSGADPVVVYTS